ncbi:cytochrome c biogenesis CcdA family protein [Candidatus Omnitrophota bacterium]
MDQHVSIGIAFVAGVLSFLSPCILPLVPGYISFLSGVSLEELKKGSVEKKVVIKAGLTSIFFVLGFSVVFITLGASASFVGKFLMQHIGILSKIAGVLIVVLGLHLTGILRVGWLNRSRQVKVGNMSPGFLGAFVIGLAFAFGWTPCVGPILAGILTLAATQDTLLRGVYLLASYSLGLGIPFIITGFAVGIFMRFFEKYKRFIRWGELISGIFLIVIGILIFSGSLDVLVRLIPESFWEFSK